MEINTYGKLFKANGRHVPGVAKQTGFPSPATHYLEASIDLQRELAPHADATFFVRVDGDSLIDQNIHHDDVLIIDRSLTPRFGDLVLAVEEGAFKVIRMPARDPKKEVVLWGKISYIIHKAR